MRADRSTPVLAQLLPASRIHQFSASLIKQRFLLGIDCSSLFRAWERKANTIPPCPSLILWLSVVPVGSPALQGPFMSRPFCCSHSRKRTSIACLLPASCCQHPVPGMQFPLHSLPREPAAALTHPVLLQQRWDGFGLLHLWPCHMLCAL